MACYTPLSAVISNRGNDGKKIVKVVSKLDGYGTATLPCGKCIGCKLAYSREWANRCVLEAGEYKDNYFVTLTYRNEDLPFHPELGSAELFPQHFTKFMKDLRRYYKYHFNHENIRFFGCGEYGATNSRPHYHLILFNLPIPDLKGHSVSKKGFPLYTSEILEKVWGKGWVIIGKVNWETSAYTARYVMKKQTGKTSLGLIQPFVRMSRSPGIGKTHYDNMKHIIYSNDKIYIPTSKGLQQFKPPKYFDRLYEAENPVAMFRLKDERYEYMKTKIETYEAETNKEYAAYVACEFNLKRKQSLALHRTLV